MSDQNSGNHPSSAAQPNQPTSQLEADRRAKLAKIREMGINPFGQRIDDLTSIGDARNLPKSDSVPEADAAKVKIAGRMVLRSDMGKLWFIRLRDESGEIQVALDAKRLSENDVALRKLFDLGDIISVEGSLGTTKKGETTIWADSLTIACKTLTPPPEKWEGLTDVEARYRQRYADLAYNPEVMKTMKLRIAVVDAMRTFLKSKGFDEVETPMLQPIHGGAAARPFETHHNALDLKLFLRIAPELYLKRLLVGGFSKVFEINRNFRNEGISPKHNPEFTMLEAYWAFASWEKMADLVEEMVTTIAQSVIGTLEIARAGSRELARDSSADPTVQESTGDHVKHASAPSIPPVISTQDGAHDASIEKTTINLARPWRRVPMATLVEEAVGWKFDKQSIANQPHAVSAAVAAYEPDGVNALSRQAAGLQLFGEEERGRQAGDELRAPPAKPQPGRAADGIV